MAEPQVDTPSEQSADREIELESELQVRDAIKRELDVRIVPWDVIANTAAGPEVFERGAFDGVNPRTVVLRMDHQNPPAGRGVSLEERSDGAYMTFRVSATQRGDEILTLAQDGVTRGVSVGFMDVPGGTDIQFRSGRRTRVVRKSGLKEVSTTWLPTWEQSEVLAVRSRAEGDGLMAESQEPVVPATEPAVPAIAPTIDMSVFQKAFDSFADKMEDRVERIETRSRQDIVIPQVQQVGPAIHKGQWTQAVLRLLTGERVPELQTRQLADLVTTDNAGVVPEAFSTELIGIIDPRRPFLNSTRRIPTPDSGMTLNMPVLTTRPTAGVQVNEKDDITSTTTSITSTGFDAITIAGGGDISLQLLKRSSPSYLNLYLELLAEALASNAEAEAISALLASGVTPGTGTLDPEALLIGEAWTNGNAVKMTPDTIWLSSDGVAEFLDAKNDGTNAPLYGDLGGTLTTISGGVSGSIRGLRPVYVPALDGSGSDVVIGPSRGFAWAEDGAFTLQVDVPAKAGRDVALVVIDWFAPLYPAAFTEYSV
jgi:HK97 family phage prohead protease/HK97 family phage major capsid protein